MNAVSEISIQNAEAQMLRLPQADCPTFHHFGPLVYIREVHMPAGALVVGHHHKRPCLNNLTKGSMRVIVDGEVKTITAPMTFATGPGRKIAYIIEDVVFQNIFATDETDIDRLESLIIDKSAAFIEHEAAQVLIEEME